MQLWYLWPRTCHHCRIDMILVSLPWKIVQPSSSPLWSWESKGFYVHQSPESSPSPLGWTSCQLWLHLYLNPRHQEPRQRAFTSPRLCIRHSCSHRFTYSSQRPSSTSFQLHQLYRGYRQPLICKHRRSAHHRSCRTHSSRVNYFFLPHWRCC